MRLEERFAFGNLRKLIRLKDFWIISFATFTRYGIFAAFQALWAGPFLMEVMGYSALATGNLILLLNVGLILGAPCWGTVSDRLFNTHKWIIVGGSISILLTIIILAMIPPETSLAVLASLFFCFGFFNASGLLVYPHIKELVPAEMSDFPSSCDLQRAQSSRISPTPPSLSGRTTSIRSALRNPRGNIRPRRPRSPTKSEIFDGVRRI